MAVPAATMYSTDAPQLIEHASQSLSFTPTDVRWMPVSARFVVTGTSSKGTGEAQVWEMAPSELRCVGAVSRPEGLKCGTFAASFVEDRHFATGDFKGSLAILDLSRARGGASAPASERREAIGGEGAVVWSVPHAHASMVNAIDGCGGQGIGGGAPELVSGGRDGAVRLWDPRLSEPAISLEPAPGETGRECWAVAFGNAFSDEERCIAAGYDNGDVKLFDLRTQSMRWESNVGNGIVCAEFDRKDIEGNKLVCTTLESKFRLFDLRTQHPTEGFAHATEKAHKSTVWMARHLPQNRDVWMTSGGNGGINLYRYHYPSSRQERDPEGKPRGRIGRIELLNSRIVSTQPVVGWDWSADKEGLAAAVCLDQTLRVFIVSRLGRL